MDTFHEFYTVVMATAVSAYSSAAVTSKSDERVMANAIALTLATFLHHYSRDAGERRKALIEIAEIVGGIFQSESGLKDIERVLEQAENIRQMAAAPATTAIN